MTTLQLRFVSSLETLTEACLLFVEQKPMLKFFIKTFNTLGCILLLSYALKAYYMGGLEPQEAGMIAVILLWVFYRVKMNRWLIRYRLKHHPLVNRELRVDIKQGQIQWTCGALKGEAALNKMKRVLCLKDGYLLMTGKRQYLWIPLSAFNEQSLPSFQGILEGLKASKIKFKKTLIA